MPTNIIFHKAYALTFYSMCQDKFWLPCHIILKCLYDLIYVMAIYFICFKSKCFKF